MDYYSAAMISEFQLLSQKVDQLAELAQALSLENAQLRLKATALSAENGDLHKRMQEASRRVAALLEKIPVLQRDEEVK